jgi:hypothetical protein
MPDVWAVIGPADARKSSTIRALTGVGNVPHPPIPSKASPPLWDVSYLKRGAIPTFVYPCALQEVHFESSGFMKTVVKSGATKVIVALRYSNRVHGDARDYLTDFRKKGWAIAGYAVLGPLPLLPGFGGGIRIPDAASTASSVIAAQLRQAWGLI